MRTIVLFAVVAVACQERSPLDRVPADARAVVLMSPKVIDGVRRYVIADEEAQSELSLFFLRTVGADLTNVRAVVLFARALEPQPEPGILLLTSRAAELTFPAAGTHDGVTVHRVSARVVAAAIPGGIVFGAEPAVHGVIDVAHGHAPGLAATSPLRRRIPPDADFAVAITVDENAMDPVFHMAASTYGVRQGTAAISGSRVVLTAEGDVKKLPMLRSLFLQARDVAVAGMQAQKEQMSRSDDVLAGMTAIASYHQLKRAFEQVEPKLIGDRLVVEARMPSNDAAMVIPAIGILSAVAIPAFMKYIRRSKTTEAPMNVRRLADASAAYYEEHHSFPPSTEWAPPSTCCHHKGGKCPPSAAWWRGKTWQSLAFSVDEPFYYQYRYTNNGEGFVAEARGDLNCDGVFSSYKREGTVEGGAVRITPLAVERELE